MDSSPGRGSYRVDRWGLTAVCLSHTMWGAGISLGLEPSPLAAQSMGAGRKPNSGVPQLGFLGCICSMCEFLPPWLG